MSTQPFRGRVLSVGERERLRAKLQSLNRRLQGGIDVPSNKRVNEKGISQRRRDRWSQFMRDDVREDPNIIKTNIRKIETELRKHSPGSMSKHEKMRLEKQITEDREYLSKNMCPKKLFNVGYKDPDFDKAKRACAVEHTRQFQRVADRYKNNTRWLDQDDPNPSNLENLRPGS